jgi:hypothetical protein
MGKRRRQPVFTDAAIQVGLPLKALFGWPLRAVSLLVFRRPRAEARAERRARSGVPAVALAATVMFWL